MNISSATAAQSTSVAVETSVLKKAIDIQAQTALALINSIPQPPSANPANLPPNLGRNINTTA